MKRRLRALPRERFYAEGAGALSFLRAGPHWAPYPSILLFLSTDLEIDTAPLLEAALEDNKKVFAPITTGQRLCFYRLFSPRGPWREGPFHIREPALPPPGPSQSSPPALDPADFPALIILPGLAFDPLGGRLGHGGGFYDRFLANLEAPAAAPSYFLTGLCLETQILPHIPVDPWDRPMDALCTGKRFIVVSSE
jgi:5-formyltetrahydrofolate cyclo-ligase